MEKRLEESTQSSTLHLRKITLIGFIATTLLMLFMNDLTTLTDGEALIITDKEGQNYLLYFWRKLLDAGIANIFFLRAINVFFILTGIFSLYIIGKRLFGHAASLLSILVLCSSPLFLSGGKFISGDSMVFLFSTLYFISKLVILKQPDSHLKWINLASLTLGLLIAPYSFGLFATLSLAGLLFFHPSGKSLPKWLILTELFIISASFILNKEASNLFYFSLFGNKSYYLPVIFLVFFPWIGFLVGGLTELFRNIGKREEVSILLAIWTVAGISSFSVAALTPMAIIGGRQAWRYFMRGYPFPSVVRGFQIIALIVSFFAFMWLMMEGFRQFGGNGFRLAMIVTSLYWMMSFLAIFALFLFKHKLVWNLIFTAGMGATFLAWALWNPIIETYRSFPVDLAQKSLDKNMELFIEEPVFRDWPSLAWYLKGQSYQVGKSSVVGSDSYLYVYQTTTADTVDIIEQYLLYPIEKEVCLALKKVELEKEK